MNISITLHEIISKGNVRANLRWLHKTNPVLWEKILSFTTFLPEHASAPQRVWHVLNDVKTIPICKLTGCNLTWVDFNRGYCVASNRSAKMKMQHERGDFEDTYNKEINQKRSEANIKRVAMGRKYRDISTYTQANIKKTKQTMLAKYGVENYSKLEKFKILAGQRVYERYLRNGGIPREKRDARRKYYDDVEFHTNESWVKHFNNINPTRVKRGFNYHLDHIFSKNEGYKNGIDPKIIGHWTNLRLIPRKQNSSKKDRCDKTLQQLLEDFAANA